MLPSSILKKFLSICQKINLEALVEVHNEEELKKTLATPAEIIGINNRDLSTFKTDLETTLKLIKKIPPGKIIISESGIKTRADVLRLKQAGVAGILVGETLMKSENLTQKITELKLK
jgi:indole-3-glycerol phosphate synthase